MLRPNRLARLPRFRFAFRLRTLLMVVGLVALCSAFYFSPAKREARAVRALESAGIRVNYDFQRALLPVPLHAQNEFTDLESIGYSYLVVPPGWWFARAAFGREFFQTATGVSFDNAPVSAEDFAPVASLRHIHDLWLHNVGIGDEHMASLAGLAELESVILSNNQLTDLGLACFEHATQLKSLELSNNRITGSGLAHLRTLKKLERLSLGQNPIDDDAMPHLVGFTSLRMLSLWETRITDAAVKQLVALTNLRYLGIGGTGITKAQARALQEKLPRCKVEHY